MTIAPFLVLSLKNPLHTERIKFIIAQISLQLLKLWIIIERFHKNKIKFLSSDLEQYTLNKGQVSIKL